MTQTIAPPALLAADALRRLIAHLGPFTAVADDSGHLESIHIRCEGGQLIGVATDRRIVAEERIPLLGGHLEPRLLHRDDADRLARLVADYDDLPVRIRPAGPTALTVELARDSFRVCTWGPAAAAGYPDLTSVLAGNTRILPRLPAPVALDRWVLARFEHITATSSDYVLDTGTDRPTRLRLGDTFRAAVMPAGPGIVRGDL